MKLITKPSVYLVGHQTIKEDELNHFLEDENAIGWTTDTEVAGEELCEIGGRLCYGAWKNRRPGGNKAYLAHILESGHGSVTEHAVFNFIFTGISRSLSLELIRHRAGISPSMLSQRYVSEEVAEYVVPPDLRDEIVAAEKLFRLHWAVPAFDSEECEAILRRKECHPSYPTAPERAGVMWFQALAHAQRTYCELSDHLAKKAIERGLEKTEARKFARQAARSVLPNATETKVFITGNARALRHFIELRASRHADPEIRILAHTVWKSLVIAAPNLFGDYEEQKLPDGTTELTTPHRKV